MSLIKEKEILKEWAKKYSKDAQNWDKCKKDNSYWKVRTKTEGIEEYDFSTLSEIQSYLDNLWKDKEYFKEIEKALAIGVLRSSKETKEEAIKAIPDFVYIF